MNLLLRLWNCRVLKRHSWGRAHDIRKESTPPSSAYAIERVKACRYCAETRMVRRRGGQK